MACRVQPCQPEGSGDSFVIPQLPSRGKSQAGGQDSCKANKHKLCCIPTQPKLLVVTGEAPTALPSSVPALTPQLEPSGAWSICTHQPPQAQCGAQTVPFSTLLTPNSLLCPSLTARGCFSLDPGQLQNQGRCSISLQGVFTSLNAFPSVLGMTPFLSRSTQDVEKG